MIPSIRLLTLIALLFGVSAMPVCAEVHEPKPGSPERKAIMDALRAPISKHIGKEVIFTGEVKVSGDWARFGGNAAPKDGKPPKTDVATDLEFDLFALLKKEKGGWKVLSWGFSGDISAYVEARKKFPQAPKDLLPDLPE